MLKKNFFLFQFIPGTSYKYTENSDYWGFYDVFIDVMLSCLFNTTSKSSNKKCT